MGWKLNTIVYHAKEITPERMITTIGKFYEGREYEKIDVASFSECLNPDEETFYIGKYKDHIIINAWEMPFEFFTSQYTTTEKLWRTLTSENKSLYSFVLNSIINLWGYTVIRDQQKIRCKTGTMDEGVILDIGEPLACEKELLSKSIIDEEGDRIYMTDGMELYEHQVGETQVFKYFEHIFGKKLNSDSELMELEMQGYRCIKKNGFGWMFNPSRSD